MHPVAPLSPAGKRIFFIEDDPAVMHLFATLMMRMPQFTYLGCAQTLESAVQAVQANAPEWVLIDINMPDGNGLEYLPRFREAAPRARLVICTAKDDPAFVHEALRGNPVDLIHKHDIATVERFQQVFRTMQAQKRFISPRLAHVAKELNRSSSFSKLLSDRELVLLRYFGRNLTDAEIARMAEISPGTVHVHRSRIMAKLDLHTSAALVAWCVKHGFVEPSELLA